jgi:Holliday junction DNA helicase RuvA
MISRLTGTLEQVWEGVAEVSQPGLGVVRQVLIPGYLGPWLMVRLGQTVTLHTLEYLESPNQGSSFVPRLVGFARPVEREFFELFTTVKGIGARKALRALAVEPSAIARAVQDRDARALQELPEIGRRLADTIVEELHGKVERFVLDGPAGVAEAKPSRGPTTEQQVQAVETLVRLGETRAEAERMVSAVASRGGSASELVSAAYAARAARNR